jgi:hypothetical protein
LAPTARWSRIFDQQPRRADRRIWSRASAQIVAKDCIRSWPHEEEEQVDVGWVGEPDFAHERQEYNDLAFVLA